jgi:hypothetical protein
MPEAFKSFQEDYETKAIRKKRKRKIEPLILDERGRALKAAIEEWRKEKFQQCLVTHRSRWGPSIILTDSLVERILGLAIQKLLPDHAALEE